MWMEDLCDRGSGMGGSGSMGKLEKGTGDTMRLRRGVDKGVEARSVDPLGIFVVAKMSTTATFVFCTWRSSPPDVRVSADQPSPLYLLLFIPYTLSPCLTNLHTQVWPQPIYRRREERTILQQKPLHHVNPPRMAMRDIN